MKKLQKQLNPTQIISYIFKKKTFYIRIKYTYKINYKLKQT